MRPIFVTAVLAASLLGSAQANAPHLPASARSASPFQVEKTATGLRLDGATERILQTGDALTSSKDIVQVAFRNGNALLLDEHSTVTFPAEGELVLEDGAVVMHRRQADTTAINCENLRITPLTESADDSVVLMRKVSADEVRITTARDTFAVEASTEEGATRVATLGDGDAIVLTRIGGIWNATFPLKGASPAEPQSPVTLGAVNEDAERFAFWWWNSSSAVVVGAVVAGTGTAGWGVYELTDDDDGGGGGGGGGTPGGGGTSPPFSPVVPPNTN